MNISRVSLVEPEDREPEREHDEPGYTKKLFGLKVPLYVYIDIYLSIYLYLYLYLYVSIYLYIYINKSCLH